MAMAGRNRMMGFDVIRWIFSTKDGIVDRTEMIHCSTNQRGLMELEYAEAPKKKTRLSVENVGTVISSGSGLIVYQTATQEDFEAAKELVVEYSRRKAEKKADELERAVTRYELMRDSVNPEDL